MITVVSVPGDADVAARLRQDLQAAGYRLSDALAAGVDNLLLVVLSPAANTDPHVEQAIITALDNGQHIIPVLAKPAPVPKLIDHLAVLDFSTRYDADALRSYVAALSGPDAHRPLKVITPRVRQANRRAGLWLGALALLWLIIGLVLVGVFRVQAPLEEFNTVDTLEAATIQAAVGRNLPHSTQEAENFPLTIQAAPTAQRPLLIATGTALVATREPRR
ncbi:MAG: toll/interleukin-1 receptor domain-containing protein [Chloroflexi bacterium]|nr:toll/interleukin-1 receptor domain-containing protein [Chloroflexota bacterium]